MRVLIAFLFLCLLAACASFAAGTGGGWNSSDSGGQAQVMRDTTAILQGMAQAHVESSEAAACNAVSMQGGQRPPCQ
jgi:hypothetical protein